MDKRNWLNELKRAEIGGKSEIKFNRLKYVGKREAELDDFVFELRQKGYSVKDIPLDDEMLLLYRVFLPRGSRMEDNSK